MNGSGSSSPKSMKIRVLFSGNSRLVHNLGDGLTPYLMHGLGFTCASHNSKETVVNSGRCLLAIGSLLTSDFLQRMEIPLDVWGSGWKGKDLWQPAAVDVFFHSVRGPISAEGLGLPATIPLGDPALLIPYLYPRGKIFHNRSILLPHIYRIHSRKAARCAAAAGCDEQRTTLVYAARSMETVRLINLKGILTDAWLWPNNREAGIYRVWSTVDRIAGASFVLTGSLHGAILAQAYGVPWAAYSDGYVDAPPKWADWGAYLGVEINFVKNLREGQEWWGDLGRYGRIRSLRPLVEAFPYIGVSPITQRFAASIESMPPPGCTND